MLVLMGSGETTPTMTSTHRRLVEGLGQARCVMLDTPFGFQDNADQLVEKTAEYFRQSVGQELHLASFRKAATACPLALETAMARLRESNYLFAGPGSPSYALAQWRGSPVPGLLKEKLDHGAVVVLASAAACTIGSHSLPVYEIYKVGHDPYWDEGLGLLQELGLPFVVMPHFNNGEGMGHDTRFCYMGERRLKELEALLPEESLILGLDEHTACLLDLRQRQVSVAGRGGVTVRGRGRQRVYPSGSQLSLDELCGRGTNGVAVISSPREESATPADDNPFAEQVDQLEVRFQQALEQRRADRAVAATLDLEQLLTDWAGDTDQSGVRERARSLLRSMVVRLGEEALEGLRDPAQRVAPFVEAMLGLRQQARQERQWALADRIREALLGAGVEVHDTHSGPCWELDAAGPDRGVILGHA